MANIKKVGLSEWLTFELGDESLISPPVLKLRLRPMSGLAGLDGGPGETAFSRAVLEILIDAIAEWDIADDGKPIPCTAEEKRRLWDWLRAVLGSKLKDEGENKGKLLGIALIEYGARLENFVRP